MSNLFKNTNFFIVSKKEAAPTNETTSFRNIILPTYYNKLATLVNPGTLINFIFLPCRSIS